MHLYTDASYYADAFKLNINCYSNVSEELTKSLTVGLLSTE